MKQYNDLKSQANGCLLLFRMGDFYELFGDDAVTASRVLEITLTSRDRNKANPMPMAGVPHHSAQGYIQRLLRAGHKVAIAEQMEEPAKGRSLVRREIIRVFTPAVQFDLEGSDPAYLATAVPVEKSKAWALAALDSSTGELLAGEFENAEGLSDAIARLRPRHFLRLGGGRLPEAALAAVKGPPGALVEDIPSNYLSPAGARTLLHEHYGVASLDAFLTSEACVHATGILVRYAMRTQRAEKLSHLRPPAPLRRPESMIMGPRTPEHLDLAGPATGGMGLFTLLNTTRSAQGARQLRSWLLAPLRDPAAIRDRQEAVKELATAGLAHELSTLLSGLYDLERISGRIVARLANPRDTLALGRSLALLPKVAGILQNVKAGVLKNAHAGATKLAGTLEPLAKRILGTQREDAPLAARDGGIFARGTSPELDRLLSLTGDGQKWLIDLEARERAATGIGSLKVRYNRVFGYYIEVTHAHQKSVPAHYQRKQTMVGAERFFTEELKKFEDEIVTASARLRALEQQLFEELLDAIQSLVTPIMEAATELGRLDALLALSRPASQPGWVFPEIDDSLDLHIEEGRHPLVDAASGGSFVPNDMLLSPATRMSLIITGPNMGGKSTVMRQVALIVILGQAGAPVPAAHARWGAVSGIHTRIGAHDAIARGQSTFMVEMTELAQILHTADQRSLIILDEIGRGTSTYDGMSVAGAALAWICETIGARTLFATHYHELTRHARSLPLTGNAHMAVEGSGALRGGNLRFLYKLREGPASESFGIHVARLAGLPRPVIDRAWKILEVLEATARAVEKPENAGSQLSLFEKNESHASTPPPGPAVPEEPHPAIAELSTLDINSMTPLDAINTLARLKNTALLPTTP